MATILASGYGSKKGTTASKFRAYAAIRVSDTDATQGYYLQIRRYLQFVPGSGYGGKDGFDGSTFWRNWGGDFKVYGNGKGDGSSKIYGDSGWVDVGWVAPGNTYTLTAKCGYASSSLGELESSVTVSVTVMSAPSGCVNTRVSDAKNTVSWTNGANHTALYLYRRVDGGSWTQLAQLSASATSYTDTTTSADHSYAYRVRAYDSTAQAFSAYATSVTTYNTPSAPAIASAGRTSATGVEVTLENESNTATALELQRSTDGSTWETVQTGVGLVTSIADSPGGGTFYYRARNTRGDLASAWSAASEAVVTVTSPAAPTILTPAASSVHASSAFVVVSWKHNSRDGSAQTAAKLEYTTDDWATRKTVEVGGSASSYELPKFAGNYTVSIRIQTAGASGEYGAKSERTFSTAFAPVAFMAKPASVVTGMPIEFEVTYADNGGSLARVEVACFDESGNQVWKHASSGNLDWEIYPDQWIPENGKEYTLVGMVRSTTTLTDAFSASFETDFIEPVPGTLSFEPDPESGYVAMTVGIADPSAELGAAVVGEMILGEDGTEYVDAVSVSLYRVANGAEICLADRVPDNTAVVDKYAPLNADYVYKVVTWSALGSFTVVEYPAKVEAERFFLYYGEDGVASAKWNPGGSTSLSHPNAVAVHYAGRKWPVAYNDAANVERKDKFAGTLFERAEWERFADMMQGESRGRGVWKSPEGDVFHAMAEASIDYEYQIGGVFGEVELTLLRIDGGDL